jgi:hypothetical protein
MDPARRVASTRGDDIVAAELARAAAELNANGWPTDVHQLREVVEAFDDMETPRPVTITGDVQQALRAATDAELVEHHTVAMEGRRYGAAAVIEAEQRRRHRLRFPRESWSTPQPGQRPSKRRHP